MSLIIMASKRRISTLPKPTSEANLISSLMVPSCESLKERMDLLTCHRKEDLDYKISIRSLRKEMVGLTMNWCYS